jgi:hypothetical protein
MAQDICRNTPPPLVALSGGLESACHFADDVQQLGPVGHTAVAD